MKEPLFPEEYNYDDIPETTDLTDLVPDGEEVFSEDFNFIDESDLLLPEEAADEESFAEEAVTEEPSTEEALSEEALLHEELSDPELREELIAADHAMYSAGLQHPEDAEFLYDEPLIPDEEPQEPETTEAVLPPAEEVPAPAQKERPVRKGRPKKRKGPGLFGIPQQPSGC